MNQTDRLQSQLNRIQKLALIAGVVALALCGFGATLDQAQFFQSYLFGYLFWFGIAIGCFSVVALHHLVGGGWGFVIQRILESGSRTLPLMLILFLPVFFGMQDLYLWARPEVVANDKILIQKVPYLNVRFFWIRAGVYFVVWGFFIYLLNKWSQDQDRTGYPLLTLKIEKAAGPALVFYVLTMSFAAFDWVMSLEPHWFSTIFGVIFVVGQGLTTLAFAIIGVKLLSDHEPIAGVIQTKHFHDLGNLMFAFVLLWAYVSFSQFFITWSGNLPEEITWYVHRLHGGWGVIAMLIVIFHFFVPLFLLLLRKTKQRSKVLVKIAGAMFFMRFVDLFWIVAPNFNEGKFGIHWMDILAPAGIGGLWLAVFIAQLKGRALMPLHDPRLAEAFASHHE
ncbi:MAG: hypothetical protein ONB46_07650 [candidate division KSB1 bacterium]|nr:hypothetical protein [candidate division KSB1 bacterium]MDZ7365517.1 hypothetical protein [candidate division KSB1 bacterium]MDZ7403620.1 hypothetical protein [candidate division KSB1 bacterium]